ncbi:MAG: 2-amino-4-hydroxy-6-hydroxymethyldihydropteridine diphosphokinase [Acidothermaceae bacterium]
MSKAVLALGANLGDRAAGLQAAVDLLAESMTVLAISAIYETAPVGGPEQPDYYNAVVVVETTLSPSELLGVAHAAEAAADRVRTVRWGPRTLDVDVIAYDDATSDDPVLTLPHPRAYERAFVLMPWLDADPRAVLPGHGSVGELLGTVEVAGVRRLDQPALRMPKER